MANNPFGGSSSNAPTTPTPSGTNPNVEKMKEVRNPYQGFQSNKEIQDQRAQTSQPARTSDTMQTSATSKATDQDSLLKRQEVGMLAQKIGNFAYEVESEVNKFLTQGTATLGSTAVGQPAYKDGIWSASTVPEADFSQVASQKKQELEGIKRLANTFYTYDEGTGNWAPKKFDKVVSEYYGNLDDQGKEVVDKKANNLINLAKQINMLENQGMGQSAQAQALRQQLDDQDEGGIVSGLWRAMDSFKKFVGDEYDKSTGMTWYGDEGGESYTLKDILTLDEKTIMDELKKASTSSSGLFGGSFEANIAKTLDTENEEYKKAMTSDAEYKNQLLKSSQQYFVDQQTKLLDVADKLAQSFDEIAPQISELVGDQMAEQWFTVLQEEGAESFAQAVGNLLYDNTSGLGLNERKELTSLIGDVMKKKGVDLGFDTSGKGLISQYIEEIATRGFITNDKGEQVKPSAIQKLEILEAFDAGDYTKVTKIMNDLITNGGINLVSQVEKLSSATTTTEIAKGLFEFKNSLTASLQAYKGSETERLFSEVLLDKKGIDAETFNSMSDADKEVVLTQIIRENPNLTAEGVKADLTLKKAELAKEADIINKSLNTTRKQYEDQIKAIPAIKTKLENTYFQAEETAKNKVSYFTTGLATTTAKYIKELADSKLQMDYGPNDFERTGSALAFFDALNDQNTRKDTALFETIMSSLPAEFKTMFNQYNNDRGAFLKQALNSKMRFGALNDLSLAATYMQKDPQYQATINAIKKEVEVANTAKTKLEELTKKIDSSKYNLNKAVLASEAVFTDPNTVGKLVMERASKAENGMLLSAMTTVQNEKRAGVTDYTNPVAQGKVEATTQSVTQAKGVDSYTTNKFDVASGTTGMAKYIKPVENKSTLNPKAEIKPINDGGTIIDSPAQGGEMKQGSGWSMGKRVIEGQEVSGWNYIGNDNKPHFAIDVGSLRANSLIDSTGFIASVADYVGLFNKPTPEQVSVAKEYGVQNVGDFNAKTIIQAVKQRQDDLYQKGIAAGADPEKIKNLGGKDLVDAVTNIKSDTMNKNMTKLKSYLNSGLIDQSSLSQLNNEQALSNNATFESQLQRAIDQKKRDSAPPVSNPTNSTDPVDPTPIEPPTYTVNPSWKDPSTMNDGENPDRQRKTSEVGKRGYQSQFDNRVM